MEGKKEQPQWLERARNNDMSAWEELVKENERIVYHVAYRMLQNEEEAKDISQEIFLKVYRNLKNFDGKSAFSTWIYRIAVNTCIDAIRKNKGRQTISIEQTIESTLHNEMPQQQEDTPEKAYLTKENQTEIVEIIQCLSPEHRAMLLMRDMEDMTYGEIAECLSLSLGTVKSRIARAREQFKKEFLKRKELLQKRQRQKNRAEQKGGDEI